MMETLFSVLLGVGLSAACGFRIFVPLLIISLAARLGTGIFQLELAPEFAWLGSITALMIFVVATLLEIGAYYIPWLDQLLDTVAGPAAVVAGVVVTAAQIHGMDPVLRWTLAVIAGGGAAAAVQTLTSGLRLASTVTTGGCANALLATLEWIGAVVLSVLAILLPPLAVGLVVVLLSVAARRWRRRATG